jgi:CheY-like chemotaxis protein
MPLPREGAAVLAFPGRHAPVRDDGFAGGLGKKPAHGTLQALEILLVEDDFIVALDVQTMLEENGAHVIGPASSIAEARELIATQLPQLAILDVNLNGEFVFPVAEELQARGIRFVFATAYADDDRLFPPSLRGAPRLAKPVHPNALLTLLQRLLS